MDFLVDILIILLLVHALAAVYLVLVMHNQHRWPKPEDFFVGEVAGAIITAGAYFINFFTPMFAPYIFNMFS